MTGPRISDAARRSRLVARHGLARTAADAIAATRAVVALHSSDPITPYLAAWARVPGFTTNVLDRALYEERSLWRLHAMRRTLFVVPADEAPVFQAAAGLDIARKERTRLVGWLAAELGAERVPRWLADVEARTLAVLGDGGQWRTQDLTAAVPELGTTITVGSGKWTAPTPLSSRLLFVLAMEGRVVRTRPAGTWRASQYGWAATPAWFGHTSEPPEPAAGRAALARRYLAAFGPATLTDLRWWTGWTARHATAAIATVKAVPVRLEHGGEAFVLPDDVETDIPHRPHVTLLPGLDPTPMGWKQRDWYLPEGAAGQLFDRNGNVGPTVWVDGRIAGGWGQRPDGEVVFRLLEPGGRQTARRVGEEAAALTDWLDGLTVSARFRNPLERELSGEASRRRAARR